MKRLMMFIMMFFAFSAFADIEYMPEDSNVQPSAAEITSNRACFDSLNKLGCSDPGEDIERFRICMNNVYQELSPSCKKLMTDLYKSKSK